MNKQMILAAVLSGSGRLLGFLFGGVDGLFYILIAFVVLDYITGVIVAIMKKSLSSEVGFKGLCRKILLFIIVAVANIVDTQIIQTGSVLRTATIFMFISNEGISILENSASMGVPIPEKLVDVLKQLKLKNTNKNESEKKENEN